MRRYTHFPVRIQFRRYRRERYARLKDIARSRCIALNLCRCKNKDITDECCHPLPTQQIPTMKQTELFQ